MITTMPLPAYAQSTVLVTSTFPCAGIALDASSNTIITSTKCYSTLLSGTDPTRPDMPQKGTATIKPEWVVTFIAIMIIFLVVIIVVLMLIIIKLAKANKQTTDFPSVTNYYDEIQIYSRLNEL